MPGDRHSATLVRFQPNGHGIEMEDKSFEPRLGRTRSGERTFLDSVLRVAGRTQMPKRSRKGFSGSRLGRGAVAARMLTLRGNHAAIRTRRAYVRMKMVRVGRLGLLLSHLTYLQRDGVARDGGHGQLYSALEDVADGRAFAERCLGNRHQFRFALSVEDAAQYEDLQPLIRRFMARMEEDLGTKLDWVAADHLDTFSPHTHVVLGGKDDRGGNLIISPHYIMRGMKERLAEIVNLDLGPRIDLDLEMRRGLSLDIRAERLTETDIKLLHEMDAARTVSVSGSDMVDHSIRIGRLRKLESLGLAERLEDGSWRLSEELEGTLRAIGKREETFQAMRRSITIEKDRKVALALADPALEREEPGIVGRRAAIAWTLAREPIIER